MFKYVSTHFADATGRGSLIAVNSVDQASSIKLLQVVVMERKREYGLWTKKVYRPYDFLLGDLLLGTKSGSPINVNGKQSEFCTWKKNFTFTIKGKFGAGIMHDLADVNVRSNDKVTVQANLGQVNMTKVDSEELLAALSDRRLNIEHTLIQQIRQNKKKVLCIVTAVAQLEGNAAIHRVSNKGGAADAEAEEEDNEAGIDASVSLNKIKDMGLVGGTAIAYRIWELQIGKDSGIVVPCIAEGCHGGFIDDKDFIGLPVRNSSTDIARTGIYVGRIEGQQLETDSAPQDTNSSPTVNEPTQGFDALDGGAAPAVPVAPDAEAKEVQVSPVENEDSHGTDGTLVADGGGDVTSPKPVIVQDLKAALLPQKMYSTLRPVLEMNPEGRTGFRSVLQQLSQNDMDAVDKILDQAEDKLKGQTVEEAVINLDEANFSDKVSCASFLRFAGFEQTNESTLNYPVDTTPMFTACAYVIGASAEFAKDSELLEQFRNIPKDVGAALLKMMLRVFKGEKLIEVNTEIAMVTENESAMKVLTSKSLGFTSDSKMVVVPANLTETMSQLTWTMYAIWGEPKPT